MSTIYRQFLRQVQKPRKSAFFGPKFSMKSRTMKKYEILHIDIGLSIFLKVENINYT
jgi:hypothetical protein